VDINDIIATIEVELEAAQNRERKALKEVEVILAGANQEGRSNLSEEEDQRCEELKNIVKLAKTSQQGSKHKLAQARSTQAELAEQEERFKDVRSTPAKSRKPAYDEVMRVGSEERTYRRDQDPTGRQFLQDVCRQFLYGDVAASSRLAQHMQEERVERAGYLTRAAGDTTTVNWSGLVVPQYLVDMVAPAVANLRPFADEACNHHPLPADGMSVNISRVTTATQAGLQSAELATVPTQSADDTLLTIPVQTAAGYQNVSRQAIDRGQGIEDTILQDLFSRYVTDEDNQLLNQATTGLLAVAGSQTWTQGTPTGAGLYGQIQAAASGVEQAMLAMGSPSHVVMHSRRWYWLSSQLTNTFPMVNYNQIPPQSTAVGTGAGYSNGIRGYLPNGLAVVVDNNVPTNVGTNQDAVIVVPQRECHLWEDPNAPAFIRAEQPNSPALGVLLVIYGYYAYTFSRYAGAAQKVTGTGLVTPAFPS
jgi:hypothetical protein